MPKMTDKQHRFIDEYLIDLNGQEAAIRAGYSKPSAKQIAYKLLRTPYVAAEVQRRQQELAERTETTRDDIIAELEEAREIAKAERRPADMIQASMGKAKLMGFADAKSPAPGSVSVSLNHLELHVTQVMDDLQAAFEELHEDPFDADEGDDPEGTPSLN